MAQGVAPRYSRGLSKPPHADAAGIESVAAHDPERTLDASTRQPATERAMRGPGPITELGRYVVLRTLGAGTMGTVYLAYDPELDRKVALKLLHGGTTAALRRALLMEAQAMAKLAHPNVVGVHDVGEHEHGVYIAMEFIEGVSLRAWLAAKRRAWREVLEVFVSAGLGLEAAHGQGLIHRDFKPDNVMVSEQGRVLVTDFGLARPTESVGQPSDIESISGSVLSEATDGHVAGTPAYMAPEQALASPLTPAADQFAFCVSLWEGVCGERPFDAPTYPELLRNIAEGRVRQPAPDRRLAGWLKRALTRGMRAEAEERWSSMSALLNALERGRRRWRWQVALGALVILAIPVTLGAERAQRRSREHEERLATCELRAAAVSDIWDHAAEAKLRSGLRATGVSFADRSVETLVPWLDQYAQAWRSGREEACLHTTVHQDWTAERSDRSMWCFEDRRLQLEATVEQVTGGDANTARRAVRLVSYLDPVETCLDASLLERLQAPPQEIRDRIRTIRGRLVDVDRLRHTGKVSDALTQAQATRAQAERLDWPPLRASTRMIEGRCLLEAGRFEEAGTVLTDAFFEASDAGSLEVAFRAARSLIRVHATLQRYREAEVWVRHADAIAWDKVDLGGLDRAEGHYLLTEIYRGLGDYAAAAAQGELALEQRTKVLGAEHPITAAALRSVGIVYQHQGRARDALEMFDEADTIWRDVVGPVHPQVAGLATLRGEALLALGFPEEAQAVLESSLREHASTLAEDHPAVATTLVLLGRAHAMLGNLDQAEDALGRAMTIHLARFGPRHRDVAAGMLDEAVVARMRGEYDLAAEQCTRAQVILETVLDPNHPETAAAIEALADVHLARGAFPDMLQARLEALGRREHERGPTDRQLVMPLVALGQAQQTADLLSDAHTSYQRALAIAEAGEAEDNSLFIAPLTGLAEVELATGKADAGLRSARRATQIVTVSNAGPRRSGPALFVFARALSETGAAASEVRAPALQARAAYRTLHDTNAVARLDTWLSTLETAP